MFLNVLNVRIVIDDITGGVKRNWLKFSQASGRLPSDRLYGVGCRRVFAGTAPYEPLSM
jgi:hypothetical protein